jgi:hypothetical protein
MFKDWTDLLESSDNNDAADGFFNILDPKAAKPWREAYQPYFSKSAIIRLEPLIHDRIKKYLSALESMASQDVPADLSMGFRSVTSDVVTSYMFADNGFELLDVKGFQSPILVALEEFFNFAQWAMYLGSIMPWITRQLQKLTKEQQQKVGRPCSRETASRPISLASLLDENRPADTI